MAAMNNFKGHSADVRMHLLLNGHTLRIAQMGPNFLVLADTVEHPPADAEIVMTVDGDTERWMVRLPNGLHSGEKEVLISKS
jgi:hypothetical protein